jgi:hypothetical protein
MTSAPAQVRPDSRSAIAAAIKSRLGPSRSERLTLNIRPKENSTAAHLRQLPQDKGGNHRNRSTASTSQQATFCNA